MEQNKVLREIDVEELISKFRISSRLDRKRDIINQIGSVLNDLCKKKEMAEKFFKELLKNGSKEEKISVLYNLVIIKGLSEEMDFRLRSFIYNPGSASLIAMAKKAVEKVSHSA